MKVAIWGSYQLGNFGDDVMAVTLDRHLRSLGVHPVVHELDPAIAEAHGCQTTTDLDTLLDGAAFALLGGGAYLSGRAPLRRAREMTPRGRDPRAAQFERAARPHGVPIHGVSLGGDGRTGTRHMVPERASLLASDLFRGGTVRLPQDVSTLERLGKTANYAPDLVLATAEYWDVARTTARTTTNLGVAVAWQRSIGLRRRLRRAGRHVRFLRTNLPQIQQYEYTGDVTPTIQYREPIDFMRLLAGLDGVLTSKHHPGLAALSIGLPFFSVVPRPKTPAFQATAGLTRAHLGRRDPRLALLLQDEQAAAEQLSHWRWPLRAAQIEDSWRHLRYVEQLVGRYA